MTRGIREKNGGDAPEERLRHGDPGRVGPHDEADQCKAVGVERTEKEGITCPKAVLQQGRGPVPVDVLVPL